MSVFVCVMKVKLPNQTTSKQLYGMQKEEFYLSKYEYTFVHGGRLFDFTVFLYMIGQEVMKYKINQSYWVYFGKSFI